MADKELPMTRTIARAAFPLALAFLLPGISPLGCGGSTAAEQAAAIPGASRAPVAQSTHGQIKLVADALGDVPLTAAQRSEIENLATDAETRRSGVRDARRDLMLVLADEIAAGTIDRQALKPKIDAVAAAVQSIQPADRAAFERLHALLAPDQRVAFVDALEARIHDRFGHAGQLHPMKQWAEDLKLTDDQRDQIRAAMRQGFASARESGQGHFWAGRRQGVKLLDAFKTDQFSMDQVAPVLDVGQRATAMSERFVDIATRVLPILTPEQRTIAAGKIRERANSAEFEVVP
jgi:Spy/CpxP family protein refolding chaperone